MTKQAPRATHLFLLCAAFTAISVLVQRSQMAPVRCGFWRASPDSLQTPTAAPKASPTKPSPAQLASDGTQAQAGLPRAPSLGASAAPGGQLSSAKSTDARPPKHKRSHSGSRAFQGPFSYTPDALLAAVEPFVAQVGLLFSLAGAQITHICRISQSIASIVDIVLGHSSQLQTVFRVAILVLAHTTVGALVMSWLVSQGKHQHSIGLANSGLAAMLPRSTSPTLKLVALGLHSLSPCTALLALKE